MFVWCVRVVWREVFGPTISRVHQFVQDYALPLRAEHVLLQLFAQILRLSPYVSTCVAVYNVSNGQKILDYGIKWGLTGDAELLIYRRIL